MASATEGPLSWQQEGRLLRQARRGERSRNVATVIPLNRDRTDDEVRERLRRVTARQDSLRIVDLSLADGRLRYADAVDLPLHRQRLGSRDELEAFVERAENTYFEHSGGLLWDATLIECDTDHAGPGRYLVSRMDHLITDGMSQQAFVDFMTAPGAAPDVIAGSHREWVRWQRATFPRPGYGTAPSHSFWAGMLGGTPPDRALRVPFCIAPDGELSGRVHSLRRAAPVPASRLRRAASRVRTTPFVLFLGAVAHTAVGMGAERDITLRINVNGRPPAYLDTLGCFADDLPVRLSGGDLTDPRAAVDHARAVWMRMMPHQLTPWDYLLTAFGGPGDTITRRPAQWLVNFMPWEQPAHGLPPEESATEYASSMGTFQVVAMMYDDDTCRLECEFDPSRFAVAGGEEFMARLCATLVDITVALTT
ncbi:hypothetical protein Drose_14435 [Dactylosporangium roseum]|uniref:Condensation domain-containing protein n=1 Tax=Dactylosporangium roseum TaxID=47989 RepID=A0ABY5ZEZ7_9ACTN|nr:condensation domain-containing protein [Dactylosporangium roseum]UWZ39327.1 hypothetical protein Drose_14435 [Dactylosporangium roseum]